MGNQLFRCLDTVDDHRRCPAGESDLHYRFESFGRAPLEVSVMPSHDSPEPVAINTHGGQRRYRPRSGGAPLRAPPWRWKGGLAGVFESRMRLFSRAWFHENRMITRVRRASDAAVVRSVHTPGGGDPRVRVKPVGEDAYGWEFSNEGAPLAIAIAVLGYGGLGLGLGARDVTRRRRISGGP
jgi:hypothetical protein